MKAVWLLLMALAVPHTALAQSAGFTFGSGPALRDTPRALEVFAGVQGYDDLLPDLYGTVSQPVPTELGALMVLRMFRNVCLGLEQGAALADITPNGFAPYVTLPFSFGDLAEPDYGSGSRVLSFTGSIDADEDNGHPFIWLRPEETGMTCRVEWHPGPDVPEDRQHAMADMLNQWAPWQFALIHASRPNLASDPPPSDVTEWDRPCGDRWCPVVILYSFSGGQISIETALNITDIEGDHP